MGGFGKEKREGAVQAAEGASRREFPTQERLHGVDLAVGVLVERQGVAVLTNSRAFMRIKVARKHATITV
jgi:hypothetical protein